MELPASGLLFKTSSKTDADGVVLFDIDSRILDGSICNVMITRDRKHKLFSAPMTLRTDFTILIPKTITLRGRVLGMSPDRIGSIRFQELFQGDAHFLGQTTPDSTGYFECRSSPPTVPNDIQTTVTLRNGSSFIQSIRATDLLSSHGATIDLLIYDRNIQVSTTDDNPIEGASINLYGTSGSLFIHVITDAAGNAPISVNSDRVEYCVGHDGYSPVVGNLDPIDATGGWRVRLHPIGFSETIRGQVIYPNGQPAPDAFVAATPRTDYPDVGSVGMCASISDSDGEFSLPVGTSTDFVVTAYLASNGLSQPVIARSGATGIVLSLPDTGTIRISVDACTASDVTGASSVEYVVASVDTSYEDSGSVYSLPIVLEELDDGEYNAYIWCPGSDWYAEGLVEVTGGSVESYSLPCARARYASGRVLDRDGRPIPDCLVRADIDSWPDEAGDKWARSVTNSGGEFRFLVPNVHVVPIAVVYDGAVRERSQLVVGRSVDLVLGQ